MRGKGKLGEFGDPIQTTIGAHKLLGYLYYFWGFLVIVIVQGAPKPYSILIIKAFIVFI